MYLTLFARRNINNIVKRYFKNNRYDESEGGLVLIWYEKDLVEKLLEKQSNLIGSWLIVIA